MSTLGRHLAVLLLILSGLVSASTIASAPSRADLPYPGPCPGCVVNNFECSPNTGYCRQTNGRNASLPNSCRWNSKTNYGSGSWYNNTCHAGYWRPQV